jgi:hypothetical protein
MIQDMVINGIIAFVILGAAAASLGMLRQFITGVALLVFVLFWAKIIPLFPFEWSLTVCMLPIMVGGLVWAFIRTVTNAPRRNGWTQPRTEQGYYIINKRVGESDWVVSKAVADRAAKYPKDYQVRGPATYQEAGNHYYSGGPAGADNLWVPGGHIVIEPDTQYQDDRLNK